MATMATESSDAQGTVQTSAPPALVDVPDAALVHCPVRGFHLARVVQCIDCPHFAGLDDRFPAASGIAFAQRYVVRCAAEPVKRNVVMLAE